MSNKKNDDKTPLIEQAKAKAGMVVGSIRQRVKIDAMHQWAAQKLVPVIRWLVRLIVLFLVFQFIYGIILFIIIQDSASWYRYGQILYRLPTVLMGFMVLLTTYNLGLTYWESGSVSKPAKFKTELPTTISRLVAFIGWLFILISFAFLICLCIKQSTDWKRCNAVPAPTPNYNVSITWPIGSDSTQICASNPTVDATYNQLIGLDILVIFEIVNQFILGFLVLLVVFRVDLYVQYKMDHFTFIKSLAWTGTDAAFTNRINAMYADSGTPHPHKRHMLDEKKVKKNIESEIGEAFTDKDLEEHLKVSSNATNMKSVNQVSYV